MSKFKVTKQDTPAHIEKEMRLWRSGFVGMPQEYVDWHHQLAEDRLHFLKGNYHVIVHKSEMVSDGWGDGMRVLQVIIETSTGNLLKLKWMDSNQDFGRVRHGTCSLHEDDLTEPLK